MARETRRSVLASVALAVGGAGCLDTLRGGPGAQPTPLPNRTVTLPEGPKTPPDRPAELSVGSVRDFALLFEYRYVYNRLWQDDESTIRLSCRALDAGAFAHGYRATVACHGQAETESGADGTTPVRDEWPEQVVTYLVDENSVVREADGAA